MQWIKTFENLSRNPDGTICGTLTSKTDKLTELKNEINVVLATYADKQIEFMYTPGNKGFFYTTTGGNLIDDSGYQCTTYNELMSNMKSILYTLKLLHSKNVIIPEYATDVNTSMVVMQVDVNNNSED